MGVVKRALTLSDFRILKSAIFQEQFDPSAWFFAWWDKLKEGER